MTFTPLEAIICNAEGEPIMHVEFRTAVQKLADQTKIAKELSQFVVLTVEEAEAVLQEIVKREDDGK